MVFRRLGAGAVLEGCTPLYQLAKLGDEFGMGEGAVGVGAGLILLEHYVFLPSTLPPSLGRRAFTAIVAMVMPRAPPQL